MEVRNQLTRCRPPGTAQAAQANSSHTTHTLGDPGLERASTTIITSAYAWAERRPVGRARPSAPFGYEGQGEGQGERQGEGWGAVRERVEDREEAVRTL